MGRQIRFFMDNGDEERFLDFVKTTGDVVVLPLHSSVANPESVPALPDISAPFGYFVWLYNRSVPGNLETTYVPAQKYYTVDEEKSPVIEFSRSIREGRIIRPGRLWVELKYIDDDGDWKFKEPEFKEWYEQLAKWIRKHYSHEINPDFYFGPGAAKIVRSGEVEVKDY